MNQDSSVPRKETPRLALQTAKGIFVSGAIIFRATLFDKPICIFVSSIDEWESTPELKGVEGIGDENFRFKLAILDPLP